MKKLRKLKWTLLILAALAGTAFIARAPILRCAGNFLRSDAPPEKADFIYVLAGGVAERCERGAELYREGYAGVALTGGALIDENLRTLGMNITEAKLNETALKKLGVPAGKIISADIGTSTLEELLYLRDYMEKNHLATAILVTSPFHSRRVRMAADRVFAGTGRRIVVTTSRRSAIDLDNWWTNERSLITVQNEYIKLLLYYVKYILLSDHPGLKEKR